MELGKRKSHADHANHVHGILCVLPVWTRSLLGHQHDPLHRATVAYQQGRPCRSAGEERWQEEEGKEELDQDILQPDYGFDFYAPQTYLDENGRRILIAWIGLPEIDTPSVTHQWAGMLSLPRELTLKDGFLVQTPLPELKSLRKEEVVFAQSHTLESTNCLIQLDLEGDGFELELSNLKGDNIVFSATEHEFMLDRRHMSHLYAEEFGGIRKAPRLDATQTIEMYVDNSVIEIFINGGKHTMTSRFFIDDLNTVTLRGLEQARLFPLKGITGLFESAK